MMDSTKIIGQCSKCGESLTGGHICPHNVKTFHDKVQRETSNETLIAQLRAELTACREKLEQSKKDNRVLLLENKRIWEKLARVVEAAKVVLGDVDFDDNRGTYPVPDMALLHLQQALDALEDSHE
jgi:hypothetical protein